MKYIHPSDERIARFAAAVCKENTDLETVCRVLLAWFDANVDYSRLSAPFFPLQRSDIDVLEMRAGACGDRSNLIVSVLLALGFDACYAYVHRDRYGDAQDHICAAAAENGRHILIDATLPYLKWHGYDCGHREYELLSQDEFGRRMTEEEAYWSSVAEKHGKPSAAGLLYAPWVHAERVFETEEALGEVFYLLSLGESLEPVLYVYYLRYTPLESASPIMAKVCCGKTLYHFSVHPRGELWDDAQWSPGYEEAELPAEFVTDELSAMRDSMRKVLPRIESILDRAGCAAMK